MITLSQAEGGVGCPISMTYAGVPVIERRPELAAEWKPKLTSTAYEPGITPVADKAGALCGMAMTEKQGGSDVRANTTTATPIGNAGGASDHRAQVVLLGPHVRCVPRPCPDRERVVMFLHAPGDSGRET